MWVADESVVPVESWLFCESAVRDLKDELVTVRAQRDYYRRCTDSLKEELRVQRLVGGNRFGGAL